MTWLTKTMQIPFWEFMLITFALACVFLAIGAAINQLQQPPPMRHNEPLDLTRVERMPYLGD